MQFESLQRDEYDGNITILIRKKIHQYFGIGDDVDPKF